MKNLVLYDLDGTLVNTREDIVRSSNHMLRELSFSPLPSSEIDKYVGRGLFQLVRQCLKTEDMKLIEKGAKIYRKFYTEHMMDHSVLYPGAIEILEYFKTRKQAVITNKPDPFSKNMLTALGVAKYFIEIVAGDSTYPKKPDPTAVLAIMKREKIAPEESLFVGDSDIDIQTARNAGIETVAVSHGFSSQDELQSAGPDAIVRDFKALLDLARKKGW